MTVALAAALLAWAGWLAVASPPEPRLRRLLRPVRGAPARARPAAHRWIVVASLLGALGAWLVFGGLLGVILAVGCAVAVPRVAGRLESKADRQRREQLEQQSPLVADLLAATVASGAPMTAALSAVCEAVGQPTRDALRPVLAALDLGADPSTAWAAVRGQPVLRPLADAVIRSADSGAPLAGVLARIAEDTRRERQAIVEVAARAAGVRAVAPLAACFLPAFLLLGVVPVVASLAGALFAS